MARRKGITYKPTSVPEEDVVDVKMMPTQEETAYFDAHNPNQAKTLGRKEGINEEDRQRRIQETLYWRSRGLTLTSILLQINAKAATENWGEISYRTLKDDMRKAYEQDNRDFDDDPLAKLTDFKAGKEMSVEQLDQCMEELRKIIMEDVAIKKGQIKISETTFLKKGLFPNQLTEYYKTLLMFHHEKNNLMGWGSTAEQKITIQNYLGAVDAKASPYDELNRAARANPDVRNAASILEKKLGDLLDAQGDKQEGLEEPAPVHEGSEPADAEANPDVAGA